MSAKATSWAWDQQASVQCKCVLLWLAERATDNGVCFPGQAEIRHKTGLSESMVRRYLHWLANEHDEAGEPKLPLVRIIERRVPGERNTSNVYVLLVPWAVPTDVQRELEELKHIPDGVLEGVGVTDAPQADGMHGCTPVGVAGAPQVGVAGAWQNLSLPDRNRESSPLPPIGPPEQQQGDDAVENGSTQQSTQAMTGLENSLENDPATVLVRAFYAGLGAHADAVTVPLRRRDMAIARQLVEVGATAAEAETYARETSLNVARVAPVDLRSFERERLGWLARRRVAEQARSRFIDRTGQPPSWHSPPPADVDQRQADRTPGRSTDGSAPVCGGAAHLAGDGFGDTLRSLLLGDKH